MDSSLISSEPPASTSIGAKLFNIFAAPGEVFAEIKVAPVRAWDWLVPVVINCALAALTIIVLFSQPTIRQQIRHQQELAFEKKVQAGEMTQEQSDQAMAMMDKFNGPVMTGIACVSVVIGLFARAFWWGLILMLLAKWFLPQPISYMRAVSVGAIASMIIALGSLVAMLLGVILGRMYGAPSLGLLIEQFDPTNRQHALLGMVNVFNFWFVAVTGLGLARVTGGGVGKSIGLFLAYWIVISLFFIALKLGQFAL